MKELINQVHNLFDVFHKDENEEARKGKSFSKRTDYLPAVYEAKNGEPVRLEIGQRRHIADLLAIETKSYNGKTPWGFAALENDMVRNEHSLYLVVYHRVEPIAFLGARREVSDIHITNLAVIPEWQGQGIGRLLLELLEQVARLENVASLSLEVRVSNERAKTLYRKMGFEALRIKKNYYHGDGEDALDMHKSVAGRPHLVDPPMEKH